ncbi:hypothetical protein C8J56DRAFT_909118 [Mycena floridula]|nr:hypothetical protein C8J56DRAFT_909118 [Mycena floridula]
MMPVAVSYKKTCDANQSPRAGLHHDLVSQMQLFSAAFFFLSLVSLVLTRPLSMSSLSARAIKGQGTCFIGSFTELSAADCAATPDMAGWVSPLSDEVCIAKKAVGPMTTVAKERVGKCYSVPKEDISACKGFDSKLYQMTDPQTCAKSVGSKGWLHNSSCYSIATLKKAKFAPGAEGLNGNCLGVYSEGAKAGFAKKGKAKL